MNPPEDHTDLAAVTKWVRETVELQEKKKAHHIIIPVTMMRTLLAAASPTIGDDEDCLYCGTSAEACAYLPALRCCGDCQKYPAAHLSGHERGDKG